MNIDPNSMHFKHLTDAQIHKVIVKIASGSHWLIEYPVLYCPITFSTFVNLHLSSSSRILINKSNVEKFLIKMLDINVQFVQP